METFQELLCSPSLAGRLQQQSIYLAVVNVILSLTAILGNFLILVTLRKQFSLHPPSKLLYRCLATTEHFAIQLALVVCYVPHTIVVIVFAKANKRTFSSHLRLIKEIAETLVYFNSTLNPFLYCSKINEVRQALKLTIRQKLCCPWS